MKQKSSWDTKNDKVDVNIMQDDIEDVSKKFKETETVYQNEEKRPSNKHDSCYAKMKQKSYRVPKNDITKFDVGSMTSEEVEEKIKELYQKVDGVWECLACNYTSTNKSSHVRRHIEIHLDGLSYTCTMSNKAFRSKSYPTPHKSTHHT